MDNIITRKDAILVSINVLRADRTGLKAQVAEQAAKLADASETMRTIANLFSASAWAVLPQRIKTYFEPYRG